MKLFLFLAIALSLFEGGQVMAQEQKKAPVENIDTGGAQNLIRISQNGYEDCKAANKEGSFFPDDFGNYICLLNYKSPSKSLKDINMILSLETSKGQTRSVAVHNCTMLSANHGSHSYLCSKNGKGFILAHYQRGYYKDNRISAMEISKGDFQKIKDHEAFRMSLQQGGGDFELKDGEYSRNIAILEIFK